MYVFREFTNASAFPFILRSQKTHIYYFLGLIHIFLNYSAEFINFTEPKVVGLCFKDSV